MTRHLRLFLYFVIGLLFGGYVVVANAETIPATNGATYTDSAPALYYADASGAGTQSSTISAGAACAKWVGPTYTLNVTTPPTISGTFNIGTCTSSGGTVVTIRVAMTCPSGYTVESGTNKCTKTGLSCPAGQNWTLSGQNCTRPDCVAPQTRQVNGTCLAPCEASQTRAEGSDECVCNPAHLSSFPTAYGAAMEGTGSSPSSACVGGCMRKTGDFCLGGGGTWWCEGGAWTAEKCTGGATDKPKPENKKPPCSASEGVMTSSSGTVACVPEGTPNARPPKSGATTTKTTAADGTVTETTKTTTTDSATGATHTETTTKTTSPSGSVTNSSDETNSGGSGGLEKGSGDNSGNEPGECAKEPDSPMCKSGTVKEKGKFGNEQDDKITEAKQAITDKLASIREAASGLFGSGVSGGGGSLPCPAPVQVLGASISFCVADYSDSLSILGDVVLFAASIIAVLMVITA